MTAPPPRPIVWSVARLLHDAEILMAPELRWDDLVRRGIVVKPVSQGPEWLAVWRDNSVSVLARNSEHGKRLVWC